MEFRNSESCLPASGHSRLEAVISPSERRPETIFGVGEPGLNNVTTIGPFWSYSPLLMWAAVTLSMSVIFRI